jgi:integrase
VLVNLKGNPLADAELVLRWPYGENMRGFFDEWNKIEAVAEIPHFTPKNYRSSCGSELIEQGEPLPVARDWLGHSSVATTARFYTNTKARLQKASELQEQAGRERAGKEAS